MRSEYIPLCEAAEIIVGFAFPSKGFNTEGKGIRLVRGKNITKGTLRWGSDTRWWNDFSFELSRYYLQDNDIVIGMDGSLVGKNYAQINSFDLPLLLVQRVACIRAKKGYDQSFIWKCISSSRFEKYIDAIRTGTSIPHVSGKQIGDYSIPNYPYSIQEKIGRFLKALDDKIELNNRINENLEQQIEALYKSWFVEFEPFDGAAPFTWEKKDIYSIARIIYGAPFSSKLFNTEGNGLPIIRIRDLKDQTFVTYTTEQHPKAYLIKPGDIVVGMDGEFRPYLWGNSEALLNQRVCVFENLRSQGKAFLMCTLKPLLYRIEQTQVATTVIHIGKKDYDAFEVLLPDSDTLDKFDEITSPMIDLIVKNRLENKRLSSVRDTLLPKLMSGELDVSEIDL